MQAPSPTPPPPNYDELTPAENSPPDLPPKVKSSSQRNSDMSSLEHTSSDPVTLLLPPPEFRERTNTSPEQFHFASVRYSMSSGV